MNVCPGRPRIRVAGLVKMIATSASNAVAGPRSTNRSSSTFHDAVRDARPEKRERIGEEQQHEDHDDVGQVDQEQPGQREFLPRTEQQLKTGTSRTAA